MRYPRYEWPLEVLYYTLTLARLGVHRRVWGYPTLDLNEDVEAYNSSQIYEGQVSFSIGLSHLVVIIKANRLYFSYWKHSSSYRSLP